MSPAAVSVVIPTVRGGDYLREAIESVRAQTMPDWELIVVCDGYAGPLDDEHLADPRIRVIRQRNRGESVARNVGVRASRSDLVAFVDDDDRMLPTRLAEQRAAMEADPGAGLCHTQWRVVDATGAPGGVGHGAEVQYEDLLRGEVHVLMPTTMMRKSVLEEVGTFDSTMVTGQDLEVIYRIARETRLIFLPEVLTEYRRHDTNASGDALGAGKDLGSIVGRHRAWAARRGAPQEVAASEIGLRWARYYGSTGAMTRAREAWQGREYGAAAYWIGQAWLRAPGPTVRDVVGNRVPVRAFRRPSRTEGPAR